MVEFGATYKTEFAPVDVAADGSVKRTQINVTVELLEILKIRELDSLFSCKLRLILSWFDQRLQFNNLKNLTELNTMSKAERQKVVPCPQHPQMWTPRVVFSNTEERDGLVKDDKATATIKRSGSVTIAPDTVLDNTFISEGRENPITLERAYKGKLSFAFI